MEQRLSIYTVLAILICSPLALAHAQDTISNKISQDSGNQTTGYGRDFWFVFPQNGTVNSNASGNPIDDSTFLGYSQKLLYLSSFHSTTVNIKFQGHYDTIKSQVSPGLITAISIPPEKELFTSDTVRGDKAIHVWSDDADLSVYAYSHGTSGGEGTYIMPTMGWGKEYVIASYTSYTSHIAGIDSLDILPYDRYYPSEFIVIADQDSTVISVTPTYRIRQNASLTGSGRQPGQPFTEILNHGECVQYQVTAPRYTNNANNLTGTAITSNKPIGVIGAVASTAIPTPTSPADTSASRNFIMDMIPPVRAWASSYLSSTSDVGGDPRYKQETSSFLVVASTANQQIKRNGILLGNFNKYSYSFLYSIPGASEWTSNAPFMLVEYPGLAMSVANPAAQFRRNLLFQNPDTTYNAEKTIELILPITSETNTTFDGYPLSDIPELLSISRYPFASSKWEVIRMNYGGHDSGTGTHHIVSDTGIGAFIFSYNYAWQGNLGVISVESTEKLPPSGVWNNTGFSTNVHMRAVHATDDSRISEIEIDSLFNMQYVRDSSFIPGSGRDSSFYRISVIDTTKPAYALVSTYDFAGNRTRVESRYKQDTTIIVIPTDSFSLKDFDFGCIDSGTTKTINAIIATNEKSLTVTIDSIRVDDKIHFAFTGIPKLPFMLGGNEHQVFEFSYTPQGKEHDTTIVYFHSKGGGAQTAKLIGCGQIPVTKGVGGYSSSLSPSSAEYMSLSAQLDAGEELALLPPKPNPVTSASQPVQFIYGLKSESALDLSLFDLLGNHVATALHDEHHPSGIYEADFFISSNIPSGSYIFRFQAAEKILSGKLIIEH